MSSDQKPETWGYGLTWVVIICLIGLIAFGAVKLKNSARANYDRLVVEKAEAVEAGKAFAAEESKKVQAKILLESIGPAPTEAEIKDGLAVYTTSCAMCHAPNGVGLPGPASQAMGAPNIAGMPRWYSLKQIEHIKAGIRGKTNPKLMAMKALITPLDSKKLNDVAGYVQSLKPSTPPHTLKGDAVLGKKLFETAGCAACHGGDLKGNPAPEMRAPALNHLPDWYIVEQLKQFKSGARGSDPKDTKGAVMVTLVQEKISSEKDMLDIAEYIKSLAK
jgi:cbb3-type cytochrome c oxidase subunit III